MGNFASFAQLLEKKIRKEIEEELMRKEAPQSSPQSEIHSELWTHLVAEMKAVHFSQNQKAEAYHRFRKPPRPRPNHVFTSEQEKAHQFFLRHKVELPLNMSQHDLTQGFRKLALKLHPDQGGSAQELQTLLWARSELQKLFQKSAA